MFEVHHLIFCHSPIFSLYLLIVAVSVPEPLAILFFLDPLMIFGSSLSFLVIDNIIASLNGENIKQL